MSHHHNVTAGIDIGDRYSHLCLLDTDSGEVIEEGRIPTNTKAFQRRFSDAEPMRIAIETGTHSPWISRMLEECGHEILVANARKVRLIYGEGRKNDKIDAEKLARLGPGSIRSCSRRSSTAGRPPRRTWRSSARAKRWWVPGPSWSTTSAEQSSHLGLVCPNARQRAFTIGSRSTCLKSWHRPWHRSLRPSPP